jgi:DNA primase catalytic core
MAMDEVTEEIRRRTDIVDLVGEYVALTPSGNERFKACCPFHNEKTPSFYVSRDKGFFKCFGCGVAGDLFKFVQLADNVPFGEAKRKLAERAGVSLREKADLTPEQEASYAERDRLVRITSAAATWFREQFTGNAGLFARDYARSRKLSRETLEAFGVGYAPDSWDACTSFLTKKWGLSAADAAAAGLLVEKQDEKGTRYYDRYRHRLMFPIWDERGTVIAFGGRALEGGNTGTPEAKYINSPEGPLFKKSRTLYAWHLARPEVPKRESIIVTEGYMDAIALHAAGFSNTVATLGTSLTPEHARMMRRVAPKTVYLCYDGDSAGMKAALRAGPMFDELGMSVRVVRLPDDHDPDTFLQEFGAPAFEQVLAESPTLAQHRIEHAVGDFSFENIGDRAEALQEAAKVIAEIGGATQREEYITLLAGRWARHEGVVDGARLGRIEEALRRQVQAAERQLKIEAQNQRRRAQEREAFQQRSRGDGDGSVISLRSASPDAPAKPAGEESSGEHTAQNEVLEFDAEQAQGRRRWKKPFGNRGGGDWGGSWKDRFEREDEKELPHNRGGREGGDEIVAQMVANTALGEVSGTLKAERALLGVMLNAPSQRERLLGAISPALWTNETHFELASYLKSLPPKEPIDPPRLFEELSEPAANIAGELLLDDEAAPATPEVIDDWIARVEGHHARQREREILEIVKGKLERGEAVTPQEYEQFVQATRDTKRARPPEDF